MGQGCTQIYCVYTCIYSSHILSNTSFTLSQALSALRRLRFSAARSLLASPSATCLSNVFSTLRPPRRGLPRAKHHIHRLTRVYQVYDRSFFYAMSYGLAFSHAMSYGGMSHMSESHQKTPNFLPNLPNFLPKLVKSGHVIASSFF